MKFKIMAPGPFAAPTQVFFSSDGSRVYSLLPNALRVSHLQFDDLETRAAEAIGRNLSETEWNLLPLGPYKRTFPNLPVPGARRGEIPYALLRGKPPKAMLAFEANEALDKSLVVKVDGKKKPGKEFAH